ncbi:MAG: hypothetical protein IANPNBLG_01019 [Bryobacteraceae bacterium]|nr:hypothetical protein [Bryobacteraceae bacterium]
MLPAVTLLRMSTPEDSNAAVSRETDFRAQFIEEHMRRVFLMIYRVVGNVADAQDLTQEVFIKVLQRQEQLRDPGKAAHWLSRIATNTAIDFLRRHGRVSFADLEETPPLTAPHSESPEQMILRSEEQRKIEAGLGILTARERMAVLLRDVEDLPAGEVARQLNCSKATVRSHIANARVKFRKFFESTARAERRTGRESREGGSE